MQDKALFTISEAREQLGGISHSKFYDLVAKGEINIVKIGRRSYLTSEEIRRFVAWLQEIAQ